MDDTSDTDVFLYYASFYDGAGAYIEMNMRCSKRELVARAIHLGYEPPKWFQFWKEEIYIYAYSE